MTTPLSFAAISSNIGRGHPQYLDSVLTAMKEMGVTYLPRFTADWPALRLAYRLGAQGGVLTRIYNSLRRNRSSRLQLQLLDRGLRRRFRNFPGILLVDHPLLAHLLAPLCRVAYIHGEVSAPSVCSVPTAWRTYVPLPVTRQSLIDAGSRPETIHVTGLLVEPELLQVSSAAFACRLQRLSSRTTPLTIGFFTSGAYPRPHLRAIMQAIRSAQSAGHRAVLFGGCNPGVAGCSVAHVFRSREEENRFTAEVFDQLDVMVSACHERTNWALGLGIPMFALLPHIGPFAQANFAFASAQGVCLPLRSPADFGTLLTAMLETGRLAAMSRAGWDSHPVTGARAIAESLLGMGSCRSPANPAAVPPP